MSIDPFHSADQFRQIFMQGLQHILHEPAAGTHILVHANACFDERILHHLKPALALSFERIAERYRSALANGRTLQDATDDQTVFLKLMAIGFSGVLATEFRQQEG